MTISFTDLPENKRVPGVYVEINSIQSNVGTGTNQRILLIGQRLSSGSVAALTPTLITNYQQAANAFGAGSMLANMFKVLFANNDRTEKWAIALDDIGGGTAATGSITVTVTTAEAGTISLYLGGVLVSVAVTAGATDAQIATAITAAINANTELPVTAAVDGTDTEKVNLTYRHKGTVGNKFDIRENYAGAGAGEESPTGVSLALVQLTGGVTDPDLDDAFSVMPSKTFHYIVEPYVNSANLNFADTEMNSRWSATRMLGGHIFTAEKGSVSTVSTLGGTRNSEHMTIFDAANNSPTPPYLWATALAGQVAIYASADPAAGFNGIALASILPPPEANRRTSSENETLLFSGIATHYVGDDGKPYIQRLLTTYQTSVAGLADKTYLDANTPFTLFTISEDLSSTLGTLLARLKIADDGANTIPGSGVITPSAIRALVIARGRVWVDNGWVENLQDFIETTIVERATNDPSRVNISISPNLVNQMQVIGVKIQFTI